MPTRRIRALVKSSVRHPSPLTALVALSILTTLALVGAILVVIVQSAHQESMPSGLAGGTYITTAQSASGIDKNGRATDAKTSFSVGQTVYIVYTVTDAGPGTVTIKLYDNGAFVDSMSQQFPQRSSYNGYFRFPATKAGDWEADLYWQNRGAGDGSLEQRVTFLVGASSLISALFVVP
jgi:hypothetical protein